MTAAAPERPDPDELLARVKAEEAREKRASLKIFFGFAPGVGKTYAMLAAARHLKELGTDVVVGWVDTHGRKETAALLEGLEVLPRKKIDYRGRTLEEFDLDGALARRPAVILVDELAHTNVEGVRYRKRWQDVRELLEAGIEVHTTLNVQHVESLNDVVSQITRVQVRETVPDEVLDRADAIELVDLTPDELLQRLKEGKVYLPEAASRATEHFFRPGNLLALRELALRRTAEHVDAEVQEYREAEGIKSTWPAGENILVCVGPSPASVRVIRAGRRIAAGLRAPWVVAYVDALLPQYPQSAADRERLEAHLRLAESLGAEIARLSGTKVSDAILRYARDHNVTRIVLGKPTHSRLMDRVRGSLLDEVVRGSGAIDVLAISGDDPVQEPPRPRRAPPSIPFGELGWAALLVGLVTGAGMPLRNTLELADQVMLYLVAIMVVAMTSGRAAAVLASALSVAAYDFFFIPPFYTFNVSDTAHMLTFAMMFAVALVLSGLTMRLRRQEREARERETRTSALYELGRELGSARGEPETANAVARRAAVLFGASTAVLTASTRGYAVAGKAGELVLDAQTEAVAALAMEHGRPAGLGTDTLPGARVTCYPLTSRTRTVGVLAVGPDATAVDRFLLDAFLRQAALALESTRLAEEAKTAAVRATTEELRSSLLSAVSHDLRTPLATITGAATLLRDPGAAVPASERSELLESICDESARLERLVQNLLDMTRIQSGAIELKRDWLPLDEVIGVALSRVERALEGRAVSVELGPDLPLVSVDPLLVEQALVNLLENAAKHTPTGTPVDVHAHVEDGAVVIEVGDRGPGLAPGDESRIFEKFQRGTRGGEPGAGLGLAICRGIVTAHGGRIYAENRPGGGALFRIVLPTGDEAPPATPPEPPA
jgi:two-component system sensor histidine kinase KdpD